MEYKINYKGYEFNITQNVDGSFNIPEDIKEFEPFGTSMKPANEPICLARKPLSEKSVAENVLKWRTGGINIDGTRISHNEPIRTMKAQEKGNKVYKQAGRREETTELKEEGRFPANIIFECICDEVIKGEKGEIIEHNGTGGIWNEGTKEPVGRTYNDKGDIHTNPMCPCYMLDQQSKASSRFFYVAKVSKKERNLGLDGFEDKSNPNAFSSGGFTALHDGEKAKKPIQKNIHPTVKPINLLTYLCRLITPPNGIILDPFMGSGSTGISAQLEGFRFVGMEMDEDYFKIAEARIEAWEKYKSIKK